MAANLHELDQAGTVLPTGPIGLGFDALRSEGIAALQGLCRALWTDYNLHDPGVTVLEQLVYGLTDLAYRTEFDVADYLTEPGGSIDYAALALHPPQDVFHGQALTVADYRRLLFDAIPSIGEVWVRALGNGLLAIDVAVSPVVQSALGRADVARRIRQLYAANRNLCEDLCDVTVLEADDCWLDGRIEVGAERAPAAVLAEIVFACRDHLATGMHLHRLQEVVAHGMPPETAYEGPRTANGYVEAGPDPLQARSITIGELVGVIRRIEGVRRVHSLAFCMPGGERTEKIDCDTGSGRYPCLRFPQAGGPGWLHLEPEHGARFGMLAGTEHPRAARAQDQAFLEDAAQALKKLQFNRRALLSAPARAGAFPLPQGRHRDLAAYYSVQNDFPAVYGIGAYGLPHSAGIERITQAQQLKGYLFPFEQLMANYLDNLQALPTLFSVHDRSNASYSRRRLTNAHIPDIEALRIETGDEGKALQEIDDYCERKGRVFDYLLALHGDAFPQDALRRFNHYHLHDTERWLLEAKARLLHELVELSAYRGRAGNRLAAPGSPEGIPVLARRVAILLGLDPAPHEARAAPARGSKRERIGQQLQPRAPGWRSVPPDPDAHGMQDAAGLAPHADAFTPALQRAGVAPENYALAPDLHGTGATLYCGSGDGWARIGHYASALTAAQVAQVCRQELAAAGQARERPRIVEHILLWPSDAMPLEKDFYGARMSVVLPDWTARCADPGYRLFVQETVQRNCPAHVQSAFLWLSPPRMAQFEALWDAWDQACRGLRPEPPERQAPASQREANAAARKLGAFLQGREDGA